MCFRKKNKREEKPVEFNCNHKYRDFPLYTESVYYTDLHKYHMKIYKPYVCIYCKDRKDILLDEHTRINVKYDDCSNIYDKVTEDYKDKILDKVLVEEQIADMMYVDRAYIKVVDDLLAAKTAPSPFSTE